MDKIISNGSDFAWDCCMADLTEQEYYALQEIAARDMAARKKEGIHE